METLRKIPVYRSKLPKTELIMPYLLEIEKNQTYSNFGPLVRELEARLARFLGLDPDCLVLVANATLAIEGAITTANNENKAWIVPSWTFAASAQALIRSNVSFQFGDIDSSWRLDFERQNVSGLNILDVAPFGDLILPERYRGISSKVVLDAAVSLPISRDIGEGLDENLGVVFSLHATKLISTGEGGLFCSSDRNWVHRVRAWSNFGFEKGREAKNIGTNAKMSEYAAAVGLASFKNWEKDQNRMSELSDWARELSKDVGLEVQPSLKNNQLSPYWIVWDRSRERIDYLSESFKLDEIETRKWWSRGCHRMSAFEGIEKLSDLNETEYVADRYIGLPFFADLTSSEMKRIETAIKSALG